MKLTLSVRTSHCIGHIGRVTWLDLDITGACLKRKINSVAALRIFLTRLIRQFILAGCKR